MTQVGNVYGEALYDLARSEGLDELILSELSVLNASFAQEPGFLRLLAAPNVSKEERCQIIDNSFRDKAHPYVLNFLKILTEKGYPRHFSDCVDAYRVHYNADHGILPVKAVSAIALTEDQSARLCEKLAKITGKTIELTNRVDPDVLGGIRLDYDGKRLEDTVANRLASISALLKNTAL
jgi:F-type H+-transporting ATPase subunit delta